MQLERFDPIFNMGFDVMRPAFNIEHKYRVTMLTREEAREPGTSPVVKGLSGLQMGPEFWRGMGLESMDNLWKEGSIFLWESMLRVFRSSYMLSWPVFMKFKRTLDQRNTLVFSLIIR
jgi:hypothetical protein